MLSADSSPPPEVGIGATVGGSLEDIVRLYARRDHRRRGGKGERKGKGPFAVPLVMASPPDLYPIPVALSLSLQR